MWLFFQYFWIALIKTYEEQWSCYKHTKMLPYSWIKKFKHLLIVQNIFKFILHFQMLQILSEWFKCLHLFTFKRTKLFCQNLVLLKTQFSLICNKLTLIYYHQTPLEVKYWNNIMVTKDVKKNTHCKINIQLRILENYIRKTLLLFCMWNIILKTNLYLFI